MTELERNNPRNEFKYRDLLKTDDKTIWENGIFNELGRKSTQKHQI